MINCTNDALSEEQFYFFGFNALSNWTIENVGNGIFTSSTYEQLQATRVISTFGYHTIRILIDGNEVGIGSNEFCYLQYKTSSATWTNVNLLAKNDNIQFDIETILPDDGNYNNQPTFQLKLGNSGTTAGDTCYYDNLRMFGVPYTRNPTINTTNNPTVTPTQPTFVPTSITNSPTLSPSNPTIEPSADPTSDPTIEPTTDPTVDPTTDPTSNPTADPSNDPTLGPTIDRTAEPTTDPTIDPTADHTAHPTTDPITDPTKYPSSDPTSDPTTPSSETPTNNPSISPSDFPTESPTSSAPSYSPSLAPSKRPTDDPTNIPTSDPTIEPSLSPRYRPSLAPSTLPINAPSNVPSKSPTVYPSNNPTSEPTKYPSVDPSIDPSVDPTINPTYTTTFSTSYPIVDPSFDATLNKANDSIQSTNSSMDTIILIIFIMIMIWKRKTDTNDMNEPPTIEMQIKWNEPGQYDAIPTDINNDVLQQKVCVDIYINNSMDDNHSDSSDMYKNMDISENKTNDKELVIKPQIIHQIEGDRNSGESDDGYLEIVNILKECDNFKKHKINDKRLKQYWLKYNDKDVWQELIPQFGIRYQFKDLWTKKQENDIYKNTPYL